MKLLQINYQDNDEENIKDVSVKLTFNEAVAIVNIAGKLNSHAVEKLRLNKDESLFDCLDSVMNMHFDYGCPKLGISLISLNEEQV